MTPDGTALVFESINPLTGYEGLPPQVFVYDASNETLACASCSPTGGPPEVASDAQLEEHSNLHSKLPVSAPAMTYMNRLISDSGTRVFFDSSQPLAPHDRNGVQDVYEWERTGTPSEPDNTCTSKYVSSVTGGCTFLISSGAGTIDSFVVGMDNTGSNVFLEASGSLGSLDAPTGHTELYDARIAGGFPVVSTGCVAAGCAPTASPPAGSASPASTAFSGAGNFPATPPPNPAKPLTRAQKLSRALTACRTKRNKHKRAACERRSRKQYGARKKSSNKKGN